MNSQRIRLLSEDVYSYVFQLLDAEPEMDGNEAGRIASRLQRLFEAELTDEEPMDRLRKEYRETVKS